LFFIGIVKKITGPDGEICSYFSHRSPYIFCPIEIVLQPSFLFKAAALYFRNRFQQAAVLIILYGVYAKSYNESMKKDGLLRMIRGYYLVTDNGLSRAGTVSDVRKAIVAGVTVVQYRNKDSVSADLYREASRLRALCKKALFLVNDRVDIALAVGADGVHIGQEDLPVTVARRILGKDSLLGVSVHTVAQARLAVSSGADYLGVGPIFATMTKRDAAQPVGLALLRKIKDSVRVPVVAIGGINLNNAAEVIASGADAVCAISAVVARPDVKAEIVKFRVLFGR